MITPLVRAGVRATLAAETDFELVGEACDGDQALQMCVAEKPDILVLDLSMPGLGTQELLEQVRAIHPQIKVLVLTAHHDAASVQKMMRAQVSGYLLKDEVGEVLVQALRAIFKGAAWFTQSVALLMMSPAGQPATCDLTPREREILERISRGLDNQSIAQELHLAEQTVRNYASTVYEKLGVKSRVEAVVWARERGIVS